MAKLAAHDSWDECSNHSGLIDNICKSLNEKANLMHGIMKTIQTVIAL